MAWQPLTPDLVAALPPAVRHWACICTSVSAEIERVTGAPMTVELIRQEDGALLPDEMGLVDPALGPATIREVVLWAAGAPRVVARTVFTAPGLRQDAALQTLGDRPLGALLFAGTVTSPVSHRALAKADAGMPELYRLITGHHAPGEAFYWARRSLFHLHDAPILCTEVFLPELLAATEAASPRR
jgi:chorismate--pyruvate lyase